MKRTLGPWTGVTVDQGTTFILRAMLAFKARDDRWPLQSDPPDPLLSGMPWSSANSWLFTKGNSLLKLRGGVVEAGPWVGLDSSRLAELVLREANAFKVQKGRFPNGKDDAWAGFGGRTWSSLEAYLRQHDTSLAHILGRRQKLSPDWRALAKTAGDKYHAEHGEWPPYSTSRAWVNGPAWTSIAYRLRREDGITLHQFFTGEPARKVTQDWTLDKIRQAGAAFEREHGHFPGQGSGGNWRSAESFLQRTHSSSLARLFGNGRANRAPLEKRVLSVSSFCRQTGRRPYPSDGKVHNVYRDLQRHNPDALRLAGVPLPEDEPAFRGLRYTSAGSLVAQVAALMLSGKPVVSRSKECLSNGDSVRAVDAMLLNLASGRAARGLSPNPDLRDLGSVARLRSTIEADCWHFAIEGQPKLRLNWTDLRARGVKPDPNIPAKRAAFLRSSLATRRPWRSA